MKANDWLRYLNEQKNSYGKSLFTINELVNVAQTTPEVINVELSRLRTRGLIERYTRGVYGLKQQMDPEVLVEYLDRSAYITGHYALYRHQVITQMTDRITCFTNRRHNRHSKRATPIGVYELVCVCDPVYCPPKESIIAEPEQALFDYVYLMRKRGVDAQAVVTFRNMEMLRDNKLTETARRYPGTVKRQVSQILRGEE